MAWQLLWCCSRQTRRRGCGRWGCRGVVVAVLVPDFELEELPYELGGTHG